MYNINSGAAIIYYHQRSGLYSIIYLLVGFSLNGSLQSLPVSNSSAYKDQWGGAGRRELEM